MIQTRAAVEEDICLEDVLIRSYKEEDKDALLDIYKEAFSGATAGNLALAVDLFKDYLKLGRAVVAEYDGEIVGFGCYIKVCDKQFLSRDIGRVIWYSQRPSSEKMLRDFYECEKKRTGGEVVVEFFDNELTRRDIKLMEEDIFFSSLAVRADFRGKGIGRMIIEDRIRRVKEEGASKIFVSCWEGGYSSNLYRKLEFSLLIRLDPYHNDGNAVSWVAKELSD